MPGKNQTASTARGRSSIFNKKKVVFLNPQTCGISKKGMPRYKVKPDGTRTDEIDNELIEHVEALLKNKKPIGLIRKTSESCNRSSVIVPRYYDPRWDEQFNEFLNSSKLDEVTIGNLESDNILFVRGGHGSPSNDQRIGDVPYIKVSDIRNLRINVHPTNMIPRSLAEGSFWRGKDSGIKSWDLVSPNRASSNIGEFAIILPGEEGVVFTKEVFVFRINKGTGPGWDPFYLLWALSLKAVRLQWQRVTLMQTNREDVGPRYREIRLPKPRSSRWARKVSAPFRAYFQTVATAREQFVSGVEADKFDYVANVRGAVGGDEGET